MRHLNKTVIAAAALLFSAANANATSVPVTHIECHETRVEIVTTNNVVTNKQTTSSVVVYEIKEAYGMMYPVMFNGKPVYNGDVTYVKTSTQAIVLDDKIENPRRLPNSPPQDYRDENKLMINRITGDFSRIYSTFGGGNGISNTITGLCEPVTLTPKF